MIQWQIVHLPPLALNHRVTPKDDRVTALYTQWPTAAVTVVRHSSAHARICLHMPMVPNSEILQIQNFHGMRKVMDVLRMVAYQTVVEGQRCFAQRL